MTLSAESSIGYINVHNVDYNYVKIGLFKKNVNRSCNIPLK